MPCRHHFTVRTAVHIFILRLILSCLEVVRLCLNALIHGKEGRWRKVKGKDRIKEDKNKSEIERYFSRNVISSNDETENKAKIN